MARNKALTSLRNEAIRKRYAELRKKNPKWMVTSIIEEVAQEFFLEPVTVGKILYSTEDDVPAAATINRRLQKAMAVAV